MPRVDPLYFALTRPVAPLGQAARGGSRVLSSLAPALMPMADQIIDDPQVQSILSGWGEKLGNSMGSSDLATIFSKAAPMVAKMAPRAGAALGAEGLAHMGDMLGAPEEMWDPAIRRQNLIMSMLQPSRQPAQSTGGADGFAPWSGDTHFAKSAPALPGADGGAILPGDAPPGTQPLGAEEPNIGRRALSIIQGRGDPMASGLREPGQGNESSQVAGAVPIPGADVLSKAYGMMQDLGTAPGSIFNASTDTFTSAGGLAKALQQASSGKRPDANSFQMRKQQFADAGPQVQETIDMWRDTSPTLSEQGALPRAPTTMQKSLGERDSTDDSFRLGDYNPPRGGALDSALHPRPLPFGAYNPPRGGAFDSIMHPKPSLIGALRDPVPHTPQHEATEPQSERVSEYGMRGQAPAQDQSPSPNIPGRTFSPPPQTASSMLGGFIPAKPVSPPPSEEEMNQTRGKMMQRMQHLRYRR